MLAKNVVEPSDAIRGQNVERLRQFPVVNGSGFLQGKPWSRSDLAADSGENLSVRVSVVLQRVDLLLQLNDQLVKQIVTAGGHTRTHQVCNDTDLIAARLQGYKLEGKPWRPCLLRLVLFDLVFVLQTEPVIHKPWKPIPFDDAYPVKVVISAVPLGGL